MKKLLLLAAAAPLAIGISTAEADTFKGRIKWVATSVECSPDGPNLGDRDNAIYHSFKDAAGERFSSLVVLWSYGADGKRLNGQDFPNALTDVTSAESVGENSYNAANNPNADIQVSVTSRTVSSGTVVLEGQIRNPYGDETLNDCVVDYLFTGLKS
jgi:hypothetical protein